MAEIDPPENNTIQDLNNKTVEITEVVTDTPEQPESSEETPEDLNDGVDFLTDDEGDTIPIIDEEHPELDTPTETDENDFESQTQRGYELGTLQQPSPAVLKTTRKFNIALTEDDIHVMSTNLSKQTMKIKELAEEKKEVDADYNKRIKDLREQNEVLAGKLIAGEEEMDVAVEIQFNKPSPGYKWVVRMDTLDAWEERMADYEYNLNTLTPAIVNDGTNDEDEGEAEHMKDEIPDNRLIITHDVPAEAVTDYLHNVNQYRLGKYFEDQKILDLELDEYYFVEQLVREVTPGDAFEAYIIRLEKLLKKGSSEEE